MPSIRIYQALVGGMLLVTSLNAFSSTNWAALNDSRSLNCGGISSICTTESTQILINSTNVTPSPAALWAIGGGLLALGGLVRAKRVR